VIIVFILHILETRISLRVYTLRRGGAANSSSRRLAVRFFRILWKKMEGMEGANPFGSNEKSYYTSDTFSRCTSPAATSSLNARKRECRK
jgi:hypothetical protein